MSEVKQREAPPEVVFPDVGLAEIKVDFPEYQPAPTEMVLPQQPHEEKATLSIER